MNTKTGQKLRQARAARGLSIEQIARETHMRVHYLRALEDGDFEALPSNVQARGFLRAYAEYLELDPADLVDDAASELESTPQTARTQADVAPPAIAGQFDEIFREVGRRLREQRELLGLSLDDVERHTHLRERYLIALENGQLENLPSPVQGRGMLNNYAIFLGLDPEPLLLRFAEGLQARLSADAANRPQPQQERSRSTRTLPAPLRRLFSGDILIGGTLIIFLAIFLLWGAIRIFAMQTGQVPTTTAPSIAEVLLASPTASRTLTPPAATSTPPPSAALFPTQALGTDTLSGAPFPQGAGDVQVYITVYQRAWMQVIVDDEVQFNGRVIPGSAYAFTGNTRVEVLTGNGAGLHIFFNQQNLGPIGNFGQVVHRIYTIQGEMTPTATITPTPTETLPPTATSTNTPTPRPGEATVPAIP
jgi:cytoskeletal protein RodZ